MDEERDFTAEAKKGGWNSEGELDAQAFVEKGEKIAGLQLKQNKELKGRIETLEKSNREFGKYQSTLLKKEKEKSAELLVQLETERATAITDGDGQAFTRLDSEIQRTRQEMNEPSPGVISEAEWGRITNSWLEDNTWYNTNQKLQTYANGLVDQITSEGYTGTNYYAEVTRRIKEVFPEEFANPNQSKPNGVESGGTQETEKTEEHSYENLDKESKTACDRFVADGLCTAEEFIENYDW